MDYRVKQLESFASRLEQQRAALLNKSVEDAIAWCSQPSKEASKPSDQYWLAVFAEPSVSVEDAHKFLVTYMLTRMRNWDKAAVASAINVFISGRAGGIVSLVEGLSVTLQSCIQSENASQQTSAASKIAMYAKPESPVFIWDQLANRSARLRKWQRDGGERFLRLNKLFSRPDGRHDYAAYSDACNAVWQEECQKKDFQSAVEHFTTAVREIGGPMADPSIANLSFMQRRLLDKFMFWEGHLLREMENEIRNAA